MTNELWLNLPVKDVTRARDFFTKLGFSFTNGAGNAAMAHLVVGKQGVICNLCEENLFKSFSGNELPAAKHSEVMFSLGAASKAEVDEWAAKATEAGAHVFGKPTEIQGWMYGCAFADLDGHNWNIVYMDMSKMPK